MAFSYDGRGLPALSTYSDALRFWENAATWRGESNERILDSRKKRRVNIRQLRDGSIACRLYNTDVVTYHPDNSMTIESWASVSTDEFANRLLGRTNVNTSFNTGIIKVRGVQGEPDKPYPDKFYRAIDTIELAYNPDTKGYAVTSTPEPFEIVTLNKTEANKVLKAHDYKAFAGWVRMMAMSDVTFEATHYYPLVGYPAHEALLDRSLWEKLLCFESGWQNRGMLLVDRTLKLARKGLYQNNPQVYDVVTLPHLESWEEVAKWRRSHKI
jgi:hypothetical protein